MSFELDETPSILGNQVTMKNIVARAAHGLTLPEKRITMAAISKIDSRKSLKHYHDPARRTLKVTAAEYAEIAASPDEKTAYRDLKNATKRLYERDLSYKIVTPKGKEDVHLRWIEKATYHHGEGWIEIVLTTAILPHLTELSIRFTKYRLEQACGLRSIYSWRLLEYLTSWNEGGNDKGSKTTELDKFRQFMEVPESYKWSNIKQKIIEPATKELAEKDGWIIHWQPVKKGRSVIAITFLWERDRQGRLDLGPSPAPAKPAPRRKRGPAMREIEEQARPGESWEEAGRRLR
jgi:plasmid replication initiation protein